MKESKSLGGHVTTLLLCLLYCEAVYLGAMTAVNVKISQGALFLYSLPVVAVCYLVLNNRHLRRALLYLLLLFIGSFGCYFLLVGDLQPLQSGIKSGYVNLLTLLTASANPDEKYDLLVAMAILLPISLFSVIFISRRRLPSMLIALGACVFIGQIVTGYFKTELYFSFFVLAISLLLMDKAYLHRKQGGGASLLPISRFLALLLPLCIFTLALALVLPSAEKGRERLELGYYNSWFYYKNGQGAFSLQKSGFGEADSELGGKVQPDSTYVLKLQSNSRLYLKGSVKDIYAGNQWTVGNVAKFGHSGEMTVDATETLNALGTESYVSENRAKITLQSLKIRTIFQPEKYQFFEIPVQKVWTDENGALYSNQYMTEGFSYSFTHYKIDYTRAGAELIQSKRGYYSSIGNEEMAEYARGIYKNYTALPSTLPQRVYDLAKELTAGRTTNYEKIKALEAYLSHLPYTLEPPDTPEGQDFVDYFLFDLQKGYCTYYASALAVLARCLGIPSRFVEGYVTPLQKTGGVYKITNRQAHAWVEIYLEGYGWIPFEPTAVYTDSFYGIESSVEQMFSEEMLQNPEYEAYMSDFVQLTSTVDDAAISASSDPDIDISVEVEEDLVEEAPIELADGKNAVIAVFFGILGIVSLVFIARRLMKISKRLRRLNRLGNLPPGELVTQCFEELCRQAERSLPKFANETMRAYAERLQLHYAPECPIDAAAEIFEKGRYGTAAPSEAEAKIVYDAYLALKRRQIAECGKIKFYFYTIFLSQ